jgi:bis(5'-nucleosyl)-tetraphosphatase (symmetrical)
MALYAIGDVQGCDDELGELLTRLKFSADRDQLWLVGDLVNRGPQSLQVLRRVRALGGAAHVVLGNHDLHLLAVALGQAKLRDDDTLDQILAAPDRDALLEWLTSRPLLHEDSVANLCMVHAGLAQQWDLVQLRACAREAERALQRDPTKFFDKLYGDEPDRWQEDLRGDERLRFIVNCLTRLRYVDADGRLMLRAKGSPKKMQGKSLIPWFDALDARWRGPRIVFGHWSTLGFYRDARVIALDTGCVWGGSLTGLRIDNANAEPVQISCRAASRGD